jgi:hypothetical protein
MKNEKAIKEQKPRIKTQIYYYKFDISNPQEKEQYKALFKMLKSKGNDLFNCIDFDNYEQKQDFYNKIKEMDKKGFIELDTKFIFNNQWNTTPQSHNLRVFDWKESIYTNRDIKEGYYLNLTEQMKQLRKDTFKCGYCGKQYIKPHINKKFCDCLESEYLKQDELYLLRLVSISQESHREVLNDKEKAQLIPRYIKAQTIGTTKRGKARIKAQRIKLLTDMNKSIKEAKTEYKGFIWLMDRGINTNNLIYYSHTDIFTFGWKSVLSDEVKTELKAKLKGFPFKYDFK